MAIGDELREGALDLAQKSLDQNDLLSGLEGIYGTDLTEQELAAGIRPTAEAADTPTYALPEFDRYRFASRNYGALPSMYQLYLGGGFPEEITDTAQIPGATDFLATTGAGDTAQIPRAVDTLVTPADNLGFDKDVTPGPSGFIGLDPDMDIDPRDITDYGTYDPTATPDYSVVKGVEPPSILNPQSMLASEMIEAQKASQPVGLNARGTINRTPASQILDDEYYAFDTVDQQTLDAPFGVHPVTGVPYKKPRTIADQKEAAAALGNVTEQDTSESLYQKAKNYLGENVADSIDWTKTAVKALVNTYVGKPVSLLFDALGAMGLEGGPTLQTEKADSLGLLNPNATGGYQDIYGINTQSAFGDYDQYNIDRVEQLESIVEDQLSRDLTNTIQMRELKDRQEYNTISGVGGDVEGDQPGMTIAEEIGLQDRIDPGLHVGEKEDVGPVGVDAGTANVQDFADIYEPPAAPISVPVPDHIRRDNRDSGHGKTETRSSSGWERSPFARGSRVRYSEGGIVSLKNAKK